ncbi:PKS-ER domain-containing protein [Fusarium sp. LHS14.1]|nr:PKS-ER domain-containing protein [Fusarium sp. LHS14.1]
MQSLMRAVALVGAYNITVIDVPKPTIVNGTDAIVRITAAAICGSDLHNYHQDLGSPENPLRIGHEAIGFIEEVGDSVETLRAGDWVVIPFALDDGHYQYGPSIDAPLSSDAGMQAEYARIPYADDSLMPVPINSSANASTIYDYLFMSDILATGWTALDFAGLRPGDTVAVFGAGPVGQMAVISAGVRGASKIYVVDHVQDRLDLAAAHGAIPVNFASEDPVEALLRLEPGGITRVVDCVGWEAEDAQGNVNSSIVLHQAGQVVAPQGGIGIVGVYGAGDQAQTVDIKPLFLDGFSVRGGISAPLALGTEMLNLISAGKVRPSSIVSAVIDIEQAPEYYARFDRRQETKVVIEFPY